MAMTWSTSKISSVLCKHSGHSSPSSHAVLERCPHGSCMYIGYMVEYTVPVQCAALFLMHMAASSLIEIDPKTQIPHMIHPCSPPKKSPPPITRIHVRIRATRRKVTTVQILDQCLWHEDGVARICAVRSGEWTVQFSRLYPTKHSEMSIYSTKWHTFPDIKHTTSMASCNFLCPDLKPPAISPHALRPSCLGRSSILRGESM